MFRSSESLEKLFKIIEKRLRFVLERQDNVFPLILV